MTQEEMQTAIRRLTKRIGEAKRRGTPEVIERLRCLRLALLEQLATVHDVWTLVNPEGKTEFLDRDAWAERVKAWIRRNHAEEGTSDEAA